MYLSWLRLMCGVWLCGLLAACEPPVDDNNQNLDDSSASLSQRDMAYKQTYANIFKETLSDADIQALRAAKVKRDQALVDQLLLQMDDLINSGFATKNGELYWTQQTFHELASEHPNNPFAPAIGPMIISMCKAPIKFRHFIKKLTNYNVIGNEAPSVIYDLLRRTVGGLVGPWEQWASASVEHVLSLGEYELKNGLVIRLINRVQTNKGDYNYFVSVIQRGTESTADEVIDQYFLSNIYNVADLKDQINVEKQLSENSLIQFYESTKGESAALFNDFFQKLKTNLKQAAAAGVDSVELHNTLKAIERFEANKSMYLLDIVRTELDQLAKNTNFLSQVDNKFITQSTLEKIGNKYDTYVKFFKKNRVLLDNMLQNTELLNFINTPEYFSNQLGNLKKNNRKLYNLVNEYKLLINDHGINSVENMLPKRMTYLESMNEASMYKWFDGLEVVAESNKFKNFVKYKINSINRLIKMKKVPPILSENYDEVLAQYKKYTSNLGMMVEKKNELIKSPLMDVDAFKIQLKEAKNFEAQSDLFRKKRNLIIYLEQNEMRMKNNRLKLRDLKKMYPKILENEVVEYPDVLQIYEPLPEQPQIRLRKILEGEFILPDQDYDELVVRIMKKLRVQEDGSADYVVSIVNRNKNAAVGVADQYFIKEVSSTEQLIKKVSNYRAKSLEVTSDIWNKIMQSVDMDALIEQLSTLQSKMPESALNLFKADRNLYNLDVFITELKQSQLKRNPQVKQMLAIYDPEITSLIEEFTVKQQAFDALKQNAKLQQYFSDMMELGHPDKLSNEFQAYIRENPDIIEIVKNADDMYEKVTYELLDDLNLRSKNLNLAQTFEVDLAFNWYPKTLEDHFNTFLDRFLNRRLADSNLAMFDINLDPMALIDDGVVINIPKTNPMHPGFVPSESPTTGGIAGAGDLDVTTGTGGAVEVDVSTGTGGAVEVDVSTGTGGAGEIDISTGGTATVTDELIETADKALSRRLVKTMKLLAVDFGVELFVSTFAIYTLDGSYYARTYAERNKQAAIATMMLSESLAGLGVSGAMYLVEASGAWPVVIPLVIFASIGITTGILLDKRYDKMDHAQKAQLFLHQLYHKYFVFYQNQRNLYQLSDSTGARVLVTARDADVLVDRIDLSGENVQVNAVGTLHMPLMDKHDTLLSEHVNVMDYWRRIGNDKPSDDLNKTDGEADFYPQQTFPSSAAAPKNDAIPTAAVDAVVLPGQPKFIEPWERRVITTKKGGVYAKNYQLGARLALTLERTLFTNFKPTFFMQENRHLYKFNHDQRQLLPTTDVNLMLPKQSLDVLLPHGVWISPFLPYMMYRLSAPEQPNQYYGFQSDYFKPLNVKDAVEGTLVRLTLNSTSRDIFWDLSLMGLSFDDEAILTQANGQIVIAQGAKKIMIDTRGLTGHLVINGLIGKEASIRYVRLENGKIKSNRMRLEDQALYMKLKQAHLDKVAQRKPQEPVLADKSLEPTTLFVSNATWEQGKATITYDDGSTDVVNIAPEDTTQVNLYRPINSIASMTFETTKSVKYKAKPTRTISKDMVIDYLIEGIPMLCYQLNQGQMARDFRATPELCTANMPSYIAGKEPVSSALGDDERLMYKMEHIDINNPKTPVNYYKLSLDNQTNLEIFTTIRYEYQGQEYRLVVDEKLLPWQKIQYNGGSQGSRADFYIPAGATLLSLRAERLLKDDLFNVFTTLEEPLIGQTMTQDRYLDINKRLLKEATMVDIDAGKREQRYLDSYRYSKQVYENMRYAEQHLRY